MSAIYLFSKEQMFSFNTSNVRVVALEGNPWFVAKDVCNALCIEQASNACRFLGKDEQQVVTRTTNSDLFTFGRGSSRLTLISESGLYKLVMRSDKKEAKAFQDWVTKIVLPAIRKDGAYVMGEEKVATGEMSEDELVLKAVGILQRKVERLTEGLNLNAGLAARGTLCL